MREAGFSPETGLGLHADRVFRLFRDDVDYPGNSVGTIECGCRSFQYFDTLDPAHVNTGEVGVVGHVPGHFFAVDKDEDVFVTHAVQREVGTHDGGTYVE